VRRWIAGHGAGAASPGRAQVVGGTGVNIAVGLEGIAEPGGVWIRPPSSNRGSMGMTRGASHEAVRFLVGLVGLTLLTALCFWLDFRVISAAFAYLILIVLLSLSGGLYSLIALSFIAVGCLSFFFAPPIFDFRIAYPEDVITVTAFLITSLTIAGLVARMRTGRDELSDLLDGLPALVWNTSSDGSADFSNQRFRDYTGCSAEQLHGLGWMDALHPEDRAVEEWRVAFAAGKPFDREGRIRDRTGEYRWFAFRPCLRDRVATAHRLSVTFKIPLMPLRTAHLVVKHEIGGTFVSGIYRRHPNRRR
jgi:PAS domain S-box-containing protein